ncbi:MAG: bifunctional diaminohydroxyphosphoribosylaminopyrimidine deaminase/5-amino-6-(5-phosphoribosylamino)uracil reductase RibD [Candidatus Omnitrophica bacterium]|nr:bifunctional diaminohydroxyphosphoribosylaminopyrimidine deaminase/5-amino-6-(5-phosphoribosylamino)uracil reductase RibD [Candidatus Omnitrophota bacterium]
MNDKHEQFMRIAIEEAKKSDHQQRPNPMVGAVIVEDNQVASTGYHKKAGEAHAEINALRDLGRRPQDNATLYVTLEPCSTQGQTGACTDAILQSGLSAVVVGAIDPNPDHQGRGIEILSQAGLSVTVGILADECEALNPEFNEMMRQKGKDHG